MKKARFFPYVRFVLCAHFLTLPLWGDVRALFAQQSSSGVIPQSYGKGITYAQDSSERLEEAVVSVPYGKVKKSTFVGAAGEIKAKDLAPRVATSFVNKMDGAVPGVTVGRTGRPGSSAGIQIRGQSSINSGTQPLIILNGMQYGGDLSSINSDDIESISVLKDASATALYGSRAAGGVILVTTKTGAGMKDKFSVNVKSTFGTNFRFIPEYQRASPEQYYELIWQGLRNTNPALNTAITAYGQNGTLIPAATLAAANRAASNALIGQVGGYNIFNVPDSMVVLHDGRINPNAQRKYTPEDWAKQMIQTKLRQDHTVSLGGNTGKTNYYVSLGYLNDPGIIVNSNFERYSFNLNVDSKVKSWLSLGANAMYRHTEQGNAFGDQASVAIANPFYTSRNMPSIYPVFVHNPLTGEVLNDPLTGEPMYDYGTGRVDSLGNFFPTGTPGGTLPLQRRVSNNGNSIGTNFLDVRNTRSDEMSARMYVELALYKGLTFRSSLGTDLDFTESITNQNSTFGDAAGVQGRTIRASARQTNINISNVLNYRTRLRGFLDDGISLNATLGHEFFSLSVFSLSGTRTGFGTPRLTELDNGAVVTDASSNYDRYRLQGVFARLGLDYMDKYFVEASVRGDQSSVFRPSKQWGAFYSVGGGWDIAKENFFKPAADVMNQLKIKASWGLTGNDGSRAGGGTLDYYRYQAIFSPVDFADLNLPGALRTRFGVPDISWERLGKGNLGVEMGFLRGRIIATLDAYYNPVSNMLFNRPLAPSVGLTSISENIGNMYTNGIEFNVTAWAFRSAEPRGFSWQVSLNGYWERNEITSLPDTYKGRGFITGNRKFIEGGSIFDLYLRRYAGVDHIGRPQWYVTTGDKDASGALIMEKNAQGQPVYDQNGNEKIQGARDTVTTNYSAATRYRLGSYLPKLRGALHTTFMFKGFELFVLLKYQIGGKYLDTEYAGLMNPAISPQNNFSPDLYNDHAQIVTDAQGQGSVVANGNPILGQLGTNAAAVSDRFLYDGSYLSLKNITLTYNLPEFMIRAMRMTKFSVFASIENVAFVSHLKSGANPENLGGAFTGLGVLYPALRAVNAGVNIGF